MPLHRTCLPWVLQAAVAERDKLQAMYIDLRFSLEPVAQEQQARVSVL